MSENPRHETTDMDPKYVLYFGVGLVVAGVLIHLLIWFMFRQFIASQARKDFRPALVEMNREPPPEPRLQENPDNDWANMLKQEEEILNRYEWIDREKGIARIPIDRAMDLLVQRGGK